MHQIDTDESGYLLRVLDWNLTIAEELARCDGLVLTQDHWRVIHSLRNYYLEYETFPPMRLFIKALVKQYDDSFGNSRMLYRLFPQGPIKQAARYAGLPRPESCT